MTLDAWIVLVTLGILVALVVAALISNELHRRRSDDNRP